MATKCHPLGRLLARLLLRLSLWRPPRLDLQAYEAGLRLVTRLSDWAHCDCPEAERDRLAREATDEYRRRAIDRALREGGEG